MAVPERSEIDEEYKWDVQSVFSSEEEWEQALSKVEKLLKRFPKKEEIDTGQELLNLLELRDELEKEMGEVETYARMRHHEDLRDQNFQSLHERARNLRSRIDSKTSFIQPLIQRIEKARLEEMFESVEGLEEYRKHIEEIRRLEPHTRSDEVEQVMAELNEVIGGYSTFQKLTTADLSFPEVEHPEREKIEITGSNFGKLLKDKNRDFREEVYEKYYDTLGKFRNTLGSTLSSSVKASVKLANIRGYKSALHASLFPNKIPEQVYDNLLETVNNNLDLLHKHVELKKEILDIDEIRMWDLYVPLTESREVEYEEAVEHIKGALKPLGEDYREQLASGIENGWIDVYENKGKRSGAYSGGAYQTKPFILMNYQDDVSSMYTLAHELGHSMHSYYSKQNQPHIYTDYSIFVAEVASNVNEALLTHYLMEEVESKELKKRILDYYIEKFRTTFYRQTLFADFEKVIYKRAEEGEALTPEILDKLYKERKEKYYEPAVVDESIEKEWMKVPHFYWNFYVYQYSTGMSAAMKITNQILSGDEEVKENYLQFLKRGSRDYPLEALEKVGVDPASTSSFEGAIEEYREYLGRLEENIE